MPLRNGPQPGLLVTWRHEIVGTEGDAPVYLLSVPHTADQVPSLMPCPGCPIGVNIVLGLSGVIHDHAVAADAKHDARVAGRHTDGA
jgi:hypothetical protein